jgi:hypothetical protein
MKWSLIKGVMLILVIVPGVFSKFYANADSLKEGLLVASILALINIVLAGKRISWGYAKYLAEGFGLIVLIVLLHGISLILTPGFSASKFFLSLLLAVVFFVVWIPIIKMVLEASPEEIDSAVRWCYWFLVFDAVFSTTLFYFVSSKAMITASEPSHFIMIFLPFLFYMVFRDDCVWHLASALIFSILMNTLSLVFALLIFVIFYYRRNLLFLLTSLGIGVISIVTNSQFSDYVLSRLNFSEHTENLSSLVFLSGYERAYETLYSGHLIGVGFQQMGFVGPQGYYMAKVEQLTEGGQLNLYDGGSLASKIIIEFGLFGIFILLLYVYRFIKILTFVNVKTIPSKAKFFIGVEVTFFCYLFARGGGYFTFLVFFFFIARVYRNYYNFLSMSRDGCVVACLR